MKIKILLLLPLVLILVSCIMPVVGGMGDPDILNGYKVIQAWQKHDTVGHTNVEQRKQDLKECGVRQFSGGTLDLAVRYPGMNSKQVHQRMLNISNCMKSKGYVYIGKEKCTKNGKPTGKYN